MLRGVLRVAGHEARRYVRLSNPGLIAFAILSGVILAAAWPQLREAGVRPDAGLYVAEVSEDSALRPVLASDTTFRIEPIHGAFFAGDADLLIIGERVHLDPRSEKSRAAARELELAARVWLDRALFIEPDAAAAYPVRVNLVYQARAVVAPAAGPAPTTAPTTTTAAPASPPGGDSPTPGASPTATPTPANAAPQLLAQTGQRELGLLPNQVDPPFPIRSLLLTFAYLVPLNFIAQLYAGSFLAERIRHRGVLLLSAPLSGPEIVLGKTVPYVVFVILLAMATTLVIGSNLVGFLAVLPVLAFLLASTLLLGLLARSPRELTFMLVAITVLLSTFLFLPAIFSQIHPVAFLSPVTVIAATIRGESIAWGEFLYATLPLTVGAVLLASLAVALYKEEELFAPQRVVAKLGNAVHGLVGRSRMGLAIAGACTVPFAIGLEIFVLIFAVTLNLHAAFLMFLFGGALVEEALKALPVSAHLRRAAPARHPALVGALVGAGFFLGEKAALIFSLVGLDLLPRGNEALATFGLGGPILLVAPLALHMATATVTAYAASRGRRFLGLGIALATALHAVYNAVLLTAGLEALR